MDSPQFIRGASQGREAWQDNPRQAALQVLVQHYPSHPKARELLHNRAAQDPDEKFREWATEQLQQLQS